MVKLSPRQALLDYFIVDFSVMPPDPITSTDS